MSDWETFSYTGRIKTRPTEYLQRDKDKQIPEAFAAFVSPLDEREEVEQKIQLGYSIYNATGIDLDRFGEYVQIPRGVMNDDEYRNEILTTKFTLGGSGTEADILRLINAVTNYADVTFVEHSPAAYVAHISGPSIPSDINQIIDNASVAGVRAYTTHDYGTGAFALAGIDVSIGVALQVGPNTAMQVDEDTALGVDKASSYLGGSRLASGLQVLEIAGFVNVADESGDEALLEDGNGDIFYAMTTNYEQGTPNRLAGAFNKED